jgi:hypothetical protein
MREALLQEDPHGLHVLGVVDIDASIARAGDERKDVSMNDMRQDRQLLHDGEKPVHCSSYLAVGDALKRKAELALCP